MAPAARTADSVWTGLGRAVSDSPAVVWFNDSVLRNPRIAKSRGMAHEGWTRVLDVCYPLIVLGRGTRRGATLLGAWWKAAPKEKRRLQSVIVVVCLVGAGLLSYGPLLLVLGYLAGASWLGRDTPPKGAAPAPAA